MEIQQEGGMEFKGKGQLFQVGFRKEDVVQRMKLLCRVVIDFVRKSKYEQNEGIHHLLHQVKNILFQHSSKIHIQKSYSTKYEDCQKQRQNIMVATEQTSEKKAIEQYQWKNNQQKITKQTLSQIIIMLLNTQQPYKTTQPISSKPHIKHSQLYPRKTYTCQSQSKQTLGFPSQKNTIDLPQDILTTYIQKKTLTKILDELKIDRQFYRKYKEQKRKHCQELWQLYGYLIGCDRQKFEEMYVFERVENVQQKIMNDLKNRNQHNYKIMRKYGKKSKTQNTLQKYQEQMHHAATTFNSIHQDVQFLIKKPRMSFETTLNKNQMNVDRNSQRMCKNDENIKRNASKNILSKTMSKIPFNQTLTSHNNLAKKKINASVDLNQQEIRHKVQSGFKQNKKYQSLNKKSVNTIVFDPDGLITSNKRNIAARVSQKSLIRKFQKPLKSNRVLLRVGGVRLSLMNYPLKVL